MVFNPDIHHRRSIRLREFDYSRAGAYFVTVCAFQRECLFGDIVDGTVIHSEAGKIVVAVWGELVKKFPSVSTGDFVVMPNHCHGILMMGADVGAGLALPGATESGAPTLGDVVRVFKSISSISVNRALDRPGIPVWQRNYYERVIRDDRELDSIRQYIADNPTREEDENHPARCVRIV